MVDMKKLIVSVISTALVTTLMLGGTMTSTNLVQQADAEKPKVYCGPTLSTGGKICAGGTNQELKDVCDSNDQKCNNVKHACQEANEGFTDARCTKGQ